MPATYEPIATTTLGSAQASVTFSSISGSYTDLILVSQSATSTNGYSVFIRVNSDTGSNYSDTALAGNGSISESSRTTNTDKFRIVGRLVGTDATINNIGICHLMNYTNTTTYKTFLNRSNGAASGTSASVGLWRNTNAITRIDIYSEAGNLISGSTFTLYGIKAA